ncbi:MAG: polysaccharide biosynthesis protein [Maricaulis sp.]|nr:polysaccharide biosynthesis protein [Maricaulis sp.]
MSSPRPSAREKNRNSARWTMFRVALYDLLAGAASMWAAVEIRYFLDPEDAPDLIIFQSVLVFSLACALVFPLTGLHRGVWRFTALNDVTRIVRSIVLANLVFLPILFLINRLDDFPRTTILIEITILIGLLLGARMLAAAWRSRSLQNAFQFEDRTKPAAILVGSETELDDALRDLGRRNGSSPFRIKALVEPDAILAGRAIRGVPVIGGLDALPKALTSLVGVEKEPPRLVLAAQQSDAVLVNQLLRFAAKHGARLTRSRPGKGPDAFSPIEAADLLNRPPRAPHLEPARSLIEGKCVLVTGAGGTIGSELSRLAAQLNPKKLILLDSSEANLYEIDLEIAQGERNFVWRPVLADVRDAGLMNQIFLEEKPQVVLHAAALKHVPLSEENPIEAVRTNVGGTMRMIETSKKHGVGIVALISTDKAVDPANVMGASKRVAELQMQMAAKGKSKTRLCVVRFGNVLGSTGSVGPLFERQIEAGGPVTVTDPEATRYFMTVEEASGLVLSAAAQTEADPKRNGALYVFDMGDPISILQFARQLIRLRGKDPDAPGAVSIIGMRPGEKRHEALVYGFEETASSEVDGIWSVSGPMADDALVKSGIESLCAAAELRDPEAVKSALYAVCALGAHTGPAKQGD